MSNNNKISGKPASQWILEALAFLIFLVLMILVAPLILVFWIYRRILTIMIQNKLGDKAKMVKPDDAFYLQDSRDNMSIINILFTMSGMSDEEMYRDTIYSRLVSAPELYKLSSYTTRIYRRLVWLPELQFDIKDHVYIYPKPCPSTKAGREKLLGEICSSPFPKNKSPWQFIILNYDSGHKKYGKEHFGFFRVHHCMGDGMALLNLLLLRLFDEESPITSSQLGSSHASIWRILHDIFVTPYILFYGFLQPEDLNILHGQQPLDGTKLVASSSAVDLDLLKKIRTATGTTINDVLLSCCSSALRMYFLTRATDFPKDLLSLVTVSVRRSMSLDNQFSSVFLKLPLCHEDPLLTLKHIKADMDQVKRSPQALVTYLTMRYGMALLPNWFSRSSFDATAGKASVVYTNVPGPQKQLQLGECTLNEFTLWGPHKSNIGFGLAIISYCGKLTIGVLTDRAILTQPRILADSIVHEINSLATILNIT